MARVERTGWLMDVYTRPGGELVCWLLSEDGQRWLLPMDFPVTFYAAGSSAVLRQAWRFLQGRGVHLSRQVRRDLFHGERIVLAVTVDLPGRLAEVHRRLAQTFRCWITTMLTCRWRFACCPHAGAAAGTLLL